MAGWTVAHGRGHPRPRLLHVQTGLHPPRHLARTWSGAPGLLLFLTGPRAWGRPGAVVRPSPQRARAFRLARRCLAAGRICHAGSGPCPCHRRHHEVGHRRRDRDPRREAHAVRHVRGQPQGPHRHRPRRARGARGPGGLGNRPVGGGRRGLWQRRADERRRHLRGSPHRPQGGRAGGRTRARREPSVRLRLRGGGAGGALARRRRGRGGAGGRRRVDEPGAARRARRPLGISAGKGASARGHALVGPHRQLRRHAHGA